MADRGRWLDALTGVVPVVPTIFHDDETVDLDGTARVVDYLIDAAVDGLCLSPTTRNSSR